MADSPGATSNPSGSRNAEGDAQGADSPSPAAPAANEAAKAIADRLTVVRSMLQGRVFELRDPETGNIYFAKRLSPEALEMTQRSGSFQYPEGSPVENARVLVGGRDSVPPALRGTLQFTGADSEFVIVEKIPDGPTLWEALRSENGQAPMITRPELDRLMADMLVMNTNGVVSDDVLSNSSVTRGEDGKLKVYLFDFEPDVFEGNGYNRANPDYQSLLETKQERMLQGAYDPQDKALASILFSDNVQYAAQDGNQYTIRVFSENSEAVAAYADELGLRTRIVQQNGASVLEIEAESAAEYYSLRRTKRFIEAGDKVNSSNLDITPLSRSTPASGEFSDPQIAAQLEQERELRADVTRRIAADETLTADLSSKSSTLEMRDLLRQGVREGRLFISEQPGGTALRMMVTPGEAEQFNNAAENFRQKMNAGVLSETGNAIIIEFPPKAVTALRLSLPPELSVKTLPATPSANHWSYAAPVNIIRGLKNLALNAAFATPDLARGQAPAEQTRTATAEVLIPASYKPKIFDQAVFDELLAKATSGEMKAFTPPDGLTPQQDQLVKLAGKASELAISIRAPENEGERAAQLQEVQNQMLARMQRIQDGSEAPRQPRMSAAERRAARAARAALTPSGAGDPPADTARPVTMPPPAAEPPAQQEEPARPPLSAYERLAGEDAVFKVKDFIAELIDDPDLPPSESVMVKADPEKIAILKEAMQSGIRIALESPAPDQIALPFSAAFLENFPEVYTALGITEVDASKFRPTFLEVTDYLRQGGIPALAESINPAQLREDIAQAPGDVAGAGSDAFRAYLDRLSGARLGDNVVSISVDPASADQAEARIRALMNDGSTVLRTELDGKIVFSFSEDTLSSEKTVRRVLLPYAATEADMPTIRIVGAEAAERQAAPAVDTVQVNSQPAASQSFQQMVEGAELQRLNTGYFIDNVNALLNSGTALPNLPPEGMAGMTQLQREFYTAAQASQSGAAARGPLTDLEARVRAEAQAGVDAVNEQYGAHLRQNRASISLNLSTSLQSAMDLNRIWNDPNSSPVERLVRGGIAIGNMGIGGAGAIVDGLERYTPNATRGLRFTVGTANFGIAASGYDLAAALNGDDPNKWLRAGTSGASLLNQGLSRYGARLALDAAAKGTTSALGTSIMQWGARYNALTMGAGIAAQVIDGYAADAVARMDTAEGVQSAAAGSVGNPGASALYMDIPGLPPNPKEYNQLRRYLLTNGARLPIGDSPTPAALQAAIAADSRNLRNEAERLRTGEITTLGKAFSSSMASRSATGEAQADTSRTLEDRYNETTREAFRGVRAIEEISGAMDNGVRNFQARYQDYESRIKPLENDYRFQPRIEQLQRLQAARIAIDRQVERKYGLDQLGVNADPEARARFAVAVDAGKAADRQRLDQTGPILAQVSGRDEARLQAAVAEGRITALTEQALASQDMEKQVDAALARQEALQAERAAQEAARERAGLSSLGQRERREPLRPEEKRRQIRENIYAQTRQRIYRQEYDREYAAIQADGMEKLRTFMGMDKTAWETEQTRSDGSKQSPKAYFEALAANGQLEAYLEARVYETGQERQAAFAQLGKYNLEQEMKQVEPLLEKDKAFQQNKAMLFASLDALAADGSPQNRANAQAAMNSLLASMDNMPPLDRLSLNVVLSLPPEKAAAALEAKLKDYRTEAEVYFATNREFIEKAKLADRKDLMLTGLSASREDYMGKKALFAPASVEAEIKMNIAQAAQATRELDAYAQGNAGNIAALMPVLGIKDKDALVIQDTDGNPVLDTQGKPITYGQYRERLDTAISEAEEELKKRQALAASSADPDVKAAVTVSQAAIAELQLQAAQLNAQQTAQITATPAKLEMEAQLASRAAELLQGDRPLTAAQQEAISNKQAALATSQSAFMQANASGTLEQKIVAGTALAMSQSELAGERLGAALENSSVEERKTLVAELLAAKGIGVEPKDLESFLQSGDIGQLEGALQMLANDSSLDGQKLYRDLMTLSAALKSVAEQQKTMAVDTAIPPSRPDPAVASGPGALANDVKLQTDSMAGAPLDAAMVAALSQYHNDRSVGTTVPTIINPDKVGVALIRS